MTVLEFTKNALRLDDAKTCSSSSASSGTGTPNSVLRPPNAGSRSKAFFGEGSVKEKVKVCVRMRAFHEHEKICPFKQVLCVLGNRILVREHAHPQWPKCRESGPVQFKVDHVQDDSFLQMQNKEKKEESQRRMFEVLGLPAVDNALRGFNTTILAYGQMGSGKTYTMTGDGTPEGRGLMPRLADVLMSKLARELENGLCTIEVSYLEIYQGKVRDLLAQSRPVGECPYVRAPLRYYERPDDLSTSESEMSEADTSDRGMGSCRRYPPGYSFSFGCPAPTYAPRPQFLKVREHPISGPYVEGLLWKAVQTSSDVEKALKLGSSNRTTGDTQVYKNSSRSHSLFTIRATRRSQECVEGLSTSYINLVDLAGSEKLQCIPADRREESRHINRSLQLLNEAILNLSRRSFVSYRSSALTWLLRESLGGNSKTFLVANISPAEQDFQESVSTLRYASKAKRIQSILTVGNDPRKQLLCKMNEEIRALSSLVSSLTEKVEL